MGTAMVGPPHTSSRIETPVPFLSYTRKNENLLGLLQVNISSPNHVASDKKIGYPL